MRKAPLVRENRHNRQPSGRGRSSKRTPTSPSAAAKRGGAVVPVPESAARPARRPRRFDFTARALIAIVVLSVVMISFANSLRVWYIQSGDLATADAAIAATLQHYELDAVSGHFHDTYGQALSNTLAALELGVWNFQSSVAGLGGCPYAKGATGNVATEDLVYLLHGMGIETGIDLDKLVDAGAYISDFLGRKSGSRVAVALLNKRAG